MSVCVPKSTVAELASPAGEGDGSIETHGAGIDREPIEVVACAKMSVPSAVLRDVAGEIQRRVQREIEGAVHREAAVESHS